MKLTDLLDQIQMRAKTAGDHVAKLCTKEDRWKMSVPVQDTDSDVLLTQITDHDVPQLAKALRGVLDAIDNYAIPRKQDDPTNFTLNSLEALEANIRETIIDALEENADES